MAAFSAAVGYKPDSATADIAVSMLFRTLKVLNRGLHGIAAHGLDAEGLTVPGVPESKIDVDTVDTLRRIKSLIATKAPRWGVL